MDRSPRKPRPRLLSATPVAMIDILLGVFLVLFWIMEFAHEHIQLGSVLMLVTAGLLILSGGLITRRTATAAVLAIAVNGGVAGLVIFDMCRDPYSWMVVLYFAPPVVILVAVFLLSLLYATKRSYDVLVAKEVTPPRPGPRDRSKRPTGDEEVNVTPGWDEASPSHTAKPSPTIDHKNSPHNPPPD